MGLVSLMLVLQTQKGKSKEPEWITVVCDGREFRMTAKIEPIKSLANRVVVVIDAPKDIKFFRDKVDNRGNK
jgi:hypothetical protein